MDFHLLSHWCLLLSSVEHDSKLGWLGCSWLIRVRFFLFFLSFQSGVTFSMCSNQKDAFRCFFQVEPMVPQCRERAWLSVLVFTFFYFVNTYLLALVISSEGATFQGGSYFSSLPSLSSFFVRL